MTLKNWIIEQDATITQTRVFAVRAETLEDAIGKVEMCEDEGVEEIRCGEYYPYNVPYRYDDSREAEEDEEEFFENLY